MDVGGDRLQYVYDVRFTPDGKELLFSRTNRRQDTLEIMAADLATGQSRLVVSEQQPTWQNNKPLMQFLSDGQRFIWETERTGWKQYELRHLNGSLLNPLTPSGAVRGSVAGARGRSGRTGSTTRPTAATIRSMRNCIASGWTARSPCV